MLLISPSYFGTIEIISSGFAAYANWKDTAIVPFSKADILKAISEGCFEERSFQNISVKDELENLFKNLNAANVSKIVRDYELREWARSFHIKRVAFLCKYFPKDPIKLNRNMTVRDGLHRIMAAIVLEKDSIDYIFEDTEDK